MILVTSESSNAAPHESFLQISIYVGLNMENVLYGIELLLFFRTMSILLRNGGVRKKSNLFYALFSSIMLFLITIWVVTTAIFCYKMWLLEADFPGGPDTYFRKNLSVWYLDLGTTAFVLLQLMTDGLMINRCRIIWNRRGVIVMPIFLWLSTLILGVLVDWTSSLPGGNFFAGIASQLAIAYYSASVFLNTILTCLICYRILCHGRKVREQLGLEYASGYFTVVNLVVESVLPYTLSGIVFLVLLGMGNAMSNTFLDIYVLMMCISPQMLILRVLTGKAWRQDISTDPSSTVKFSPVDESEPQGSIDIETKAQVQALSRAYLSHGHVSHEVVFAIV